MSYYIPYVIEQSERGERGFGSTGFGTQKSGVNA